MGERKGVNKYYPPDYDPSKGGLNAYHGTHALRERAKKIDQGILIIRFEMPYNIWCNGCGNHIGMGVRYNAEKRRVGAYYSTPIYKFRMKCALCDQFFEIRTDPQNCDYEILSGCRRKEERWDTEAAGNVQTTHREVKEKMMTNAMFQLEHNAEDKVKVKKLAPTLTRLEEIRDTWDDDFSVNQKLRKKFRKEKKEIKDKEDSNSSFKNNKGLPEDFVLQDEHQDDVIKSKRMRYGEDTRPDHVRKRQRTSIKQSSIFGIEARKFQLSKALSTSSPKQKTPSTSSSPTDSNFKAMALGIVRKRKRSAASSETDLTPSTQSETQKSGLNKSASLEHSITSVNESQIILDSISNEKVSSKPTLDSSKPDSKISIDKSQGTSCNKLYTKDIDVSLNEAEFSKRLDKKNLELTTSELVDKNTDEKSKIGKESKTLFSVDRDIVITNSNKNDKEPKTENTEPTDISADGKDDISNKDATTPNSLVQENTDSDRTDISKNSSADGKDITTSKGAIADSSISSLVSYELIRQ
ncbi:coiled-coil domain-containing protein 130 homolog isoform X2 [Clytia hemisphaerica]|uniref:coiled-coil domain-containing protein 130 homolog isoform X2 n=1 Tax=Clytia hemisphaerica TaxID=252671 RepID=UPI0034D5515E